MAVGIAVDVEAGREEMAVKIRERIDIGDTEARMRLPIQFRVRLYHN